MVVPSPRQDFMGFSSCSFSMSLLKEYTVNARELGLNLERCSGFMTL